MQSIEIQKKFKEEKRKILSDRKSKLKIEKAKVKQVNAVTKNKIKKTTPSKVVNIPKKKYIYKRKNTGEKELFDKIWNERQHICMICNKFIQEPLSWCFAHLLAKGQYKEYRLNKDNIALVCSIDCHKSIDSIVIGNNKKIVKYGLDIGLDIYSIMQTLGK